MLRKPPSRLAGEYDDEVGSSRPHFLDHRMEFFNTQCKAQALTERGWHGYGYNVAGRSGRLPARLLSHRAANPYARCCSF
jgi:hypothetical protein